METRTVFIGTAAWSVPKALGTTFASEGTHLERYSQILNCVEINTAFYRDHKPETYEKWARSTPDNFRFAVKLSRAFTHDDQLAVNPAALREVVEGIMRLGGKLGVILIQLPPKLAFHKATVDTFFKELRAIYPGPLVIEPRHKSWIGADALQVLKTFGVGKVIADPEPCPSGPEFQKVTADICYIRWHGSPVIYESRYDQDSLDQLKKQVDQLQADFKSVWIIFDNTTFGWATVNALETRSMFNSERRIAEAKFPIGYAAEDSITL